MADEMIGPVTTRRVKCDCGRWKGEGRDEDRTGLKRWQRSDMEVIRTYRIVEAALIVMEGSQPSKSKKGRRPQKPRKDQKEAPSAYRSLKPVEEENSNQLVTDLGFFPSRYFRVREEVAIWGQCPFPATVPKPVLYEWKERVPMGAFRDHEIGGRGAAGESCPIELKLVELVS